MKGSATKRRKKKKQNLEQEHREKRVNGVFFCVRIDFLSKLVISLIYT